MGDIAKIAGLAGTVVAAGAAAGAINSYVNHKLAGPSVNDSSPTASPFFFGSSRPYVHPKKSFWEKNALFVGCLSVLLIIIAAILIYHCCSQSSDRRQPLFDLENPPPRRNGHHWGNIVRARRNSDKDLREI